MGEILTKCSANESPFMETVLTKLSEVNNRLADLSKKNFEINRRAGIYEDEPCEDSGRADGSTNLKEALAESLYITTALLSSLESRASELQRFI